MAGPFNRSDAPAVVAIAPQFDYAATVAVLGGVLVGANAVSHGYFALVRTALDLPGTKINGSLLSPRLAGSTVNLWSSLAVQGLAVLALYGIARTGKTGGTLAVTLLAALWLVWLYANYGALAAQLAKTQESGPSATQGAGGGGGGSTTKR